MACEICGRGSCTRSFHALEEQQGFDDVADNVKNRMKEYLKNKIDRLPDEGHDDGKALVNLADVLSLIDDYC